MNGSNDKTIAGHMIAPLVQKYMQRLQERELEIAALLEHAQKEGFTPGNHEQLRHYAHNLAGSGATYGYPNISEAGLALEDILDSQAEAKTVIALTKVLLDNIRIAMVGGEATRYAQGHAEARVAGPLEKNDCAVGKKTVLVIDDDPDTPKLITEILKDTVNVLVAPDGETGLSRIAEYKPDLVLLDIDMPGMNGNAVLKKLQQDPQLQKTPVIMLTAYRRGTDVVQAMMGGAIGYVVKPFQVEDLAARIHEMLAHIDTTVLIADDDESIRDLLYYKFRRTGVNVITAFDGEEALALAKEHQPQLAIIDWMMPGLDGPALLRKLKRDETTMKTKVVMLTVKHQEQNVLEGFKLGVGDYIVKPFIAEEVVVRSLRLLGLTQTMGE